MEFKFNFPRVYTTILLYNQVKQSLIRGTFVILSFTVLPSQAAAQNQENDSTQQEQYKENMHLQWVINAYRSKYKLPKLFYRFSSQYECDKRVSEIQKNFTIPEEGYEGICDGEVIFRDSTYIGLLGQMIERTEFYYDKDIRYICLAKREKENWFYVVVRMWKQ
jgi:hypothetical protein